MKSKRVNRLMSRWIFDDVHIKCKLRFCFAGTQQGTENSRMYNEMAIIKLVQSMTKLLQSPPDVFRAQIIRHFAERGIAMYERIKGWMKASDHINNRTKSTEDADVKVDPELIDLMPKFSLVPASRGFCLTLNALLENFRTKIEDLKDRTETKPAEL